jgi:hypothetical protein
MTSILPPLPAPVEGFVAPKILGCQVDLQVGGGRAREENEEIQRDSPGRLNSRTAPRMRKENGPGGSLRGRFGVSEI